MSTHEWDYITVKSKLMPQMRRCRNRGIRVKVEFILYALKIRNVALASQRMGFGRRSFYKWWQRLVRGKFKIKALLEQSRRPKNSPRKVGGFVERRIRHYHRKNYGAPMIFAFLEREGIKVSQSTISHVLSDRGRRKKIKRTRLNKHMRRYELAIPGERLQIDVKYVPDKVGGEQVYNFNIIDECTRWRFCYSYKALNEHSTLDFLKRFKKACPFPIHCIQSDHGPEFTFKFFPNAKTEHLMDAWCRAHKIRHRLIPVGVKEHNGKVERSHRIDADYFFWRAPTANLDVFNRALVQWIQFYNRHRPHYGIGRMTPQEKLEERMEGLKGEKVAAHLEPLRQRFLAEAPMLMTKAGAEILRLERSIKEYDLDIAS